MVQTPLTLNLEKTNLSDEQFYQLCLVNRELKFEGTSEGKLIIMSPTGGETGNRNLKLIQQLANWADQDGTGIAFDSSSGFKLPNGAIRSPDAAWITLEKWHRLTLEERSKFPPICPDFVVELRSASDALSPLQSKMIEYLEHGTRLGWLINRQQQQVEIYRANQTKEVLDSPKSLSGEEILFNFILNLAPIW
jgi:Uma2 family endonuclease